MIGRSGNRIPLVTGSITCKYHMDLKVPKVTQRREKKVESVKPELFSLSCGQKMKVLILQGLLLGLIKSKQIYLKQFLTLTLEK